VELVYDQLRLSYSICSFKCHTKDYFCLSYQTC